MLRDDLTALSVFLAVAEERSFTRAAKRLGVSPSAISHAMRGLEEEIGVRLLSRTTRSVAPTDAGEHLLTRLRPAFTEVREALGHLSGLRNKPAGRVRILVPRLAAKIVLPSKLGQFARDYPDIVLDVTTDDSRQDIVAVRVSRDQRPVIVGSPGYFKTHPKPKSPRDLLSHQCINFRHGSTDVYRWEFQKGKKSLSVAVSGPLIVDDLEIVISAAVDGVGLAFMAEENAAQHLASGALVQVLEDWCQPYPGFFIYYPSRRQQPAALSALTNALRL
jgi:DNA-binding transcriptional LysR family regulator